MSTDNKRLATPSKLKELGKKAVCETKKVKCGR